MASRRSKARLPSSDRRSSRRSSKSSRAPRERSSTKLLEVLHTPRNAETPRAGLRSRRTPNRSFFVRSHFPEPALPSAVWAFEVDGAVRHPGRYTLADLRASPRHRATVTLECAGNGRAGFGRAAPGELSWGPGAVSTATWEGVPLRWILRRAGPTPGAREVLITGFDGDAGAPVESGRIFARSLPIDRALTDPDLLIATRMNGVRLPRSHGGPVRLVVPGWYAMASVKWVRRITVLTTPFRGYFQTSKYVYERGNRGRRASSPVSEVRVKSILTNPSPGARLPIGRPVRLRGKAWSGRGPVVRVEVDVGAGWQAAALSRGTGRHEWSQWDFSWRPEKVGRIEVRIRATDASGASQPRRPFANRFQYGYNAVEAVRMSVVER